MKPRAFCEFPAGLAAVSLRLHGGRHCRPPISRMGNKQGYAEVILDALGLRSGQGADAYLWAEADPDVRALLRAYPDAAMLTRIAEIIRGWADEEPRALWERLRAERKARPPMGDAAVGGWIIEGMWSYRQGDLTSGGPVLPGERRQDTSAAAAACKNLAMYATIVGGNRLVNMGGPDLMNTGNGGTRFGGDDFATPAGDVAGAFEAFAQSTAAAAAAARTMPQAQARGASDGDFLPRVAPSGVVRYAQDAPAEGMADLAAYALLGQWSYRRGVPESGFNAGLLEDREPTDTGGNGAKARTCEQEAGLWATPAGASRWPTVAVLAAIPSAADVAAWLGTPGDLSGVVCYADPPYAGTSGYGSNLTREEVIAYALNFDALGAVVCISEAEPLIDTWYATEITGGRKGQKRTFSKQQREWLTMNRPPAATVATQTRMFA